MKKAILPIIIVLFSTVANSQNNTQNFQELWNEVQKFELENLPKSALKVVENIYTKAKKDHNASQIIKSLLYKSKFALTLEEDAQLSIIKNLKQEISESPFPTKNILESVLADVYWQYFQQNRWKFYNRTETEEKIDTSDFRTWDLKTIFSEVQNHYNNSLSNSLEAQLTALDKFDEIIDTTKDSKVFRPTLYDFLAHRAIDFFQNEEQNIIRPSYKFELDNEHLLGNNSEFTSQTIQSKDSISNHLQALKIYKNLTLFHLKDTNPTALINVTLERLNFVKTNTVLNTKEELYLKALQTFKKEFKNHEASSEIDFEMAKLLNDQGKLYQPKTATTNQFKLKEALEICNTAIHNYPTSTGAKKCELLKNEILSKYISIQTENYVPITTNARLLVTYKNLEQVYFTAFEITKTQQTKFNSIYKDSLKTTFINNLKPTIKWEAELKSENDFQQHATEVLLPKLTQATYLIVATVADKLTYENPIFTHTFIQATNLALIENRQTSKYVYQVVDRNTGKPIENAQVNLKNYNTSRYNKSINKNFVTNNNGEFNYTPNNTYRNIIATVKTNKDHATFGDFYMYENRYRDTKNKDEKPRINSFIFTDRSIYRPGQTVYFKGISLKTFNEKTEVHTNEFIEISLKNPNGELVKKHDLKLNEFGSISGEFILPTNGLTGEYTIVLNRSNQQNGTDFNTVNYNYTSKSISVEEYKRPKFETTFKPIKETYKLNDSVVINGEAIAFAGSKISNAKVIYRVKRTANFPRWYNWRMSNNYQSEALEITNGETSTDNDGSYKITFKALPDLKVSEESLPTFNYTVYADVTDINGETRSTETIVKVGYHALEASVAIPSKIDKNSKENSLTITTNNLNNEFIPTKGTIKIYKLKSPKNPLRIRPWEAPDYEGFSRDEFEKLFPHDPFSSEENGIENWELSTLVFEKEFNTETSKKMELGNLKKWLSGNYKVILECNDEFNQAVKDKQTFELFGENEKVIADNKLFIISTDKDNYKPNEFVNLSVGSASLDMTVMLFVEKNYAVVASHYIHLNNETKTIKIPVSENDLGGFAIKYHFVNYNSFQNGTALISVPYPQKKLQIETLTFRDKLQPGSEQTWSFKITGSQSEKITSEVLASMYDASLDEFKTHHWNFNPISYPTYYSYSNSNANNSFKTLQFVVKNETFRYSYFPTQSYDALNWFGFSFNNNFWVKQQYLNSVRAVTVKNSYDATKPKGFIYGTVYASDGLPLPGVSIIVKGTTNGVVSDFDGNYTIKATKGDKITFSFIGMNTSVVTIDKNNIISVYLSESGESLDEVVVTGYGSVKRKSVTGSVVEMEEDVSMDLEGVVAGVQIRGVASLDSKAQPIYIIDGVIYEENPNLNPNEITTVEVLKDAAATALYGAKAVNGVIIITTKNGSSKIENELLKVQTRKDFKETAFFYPHLTTDKDGSISFNFTIPEALTRWKLQLLAHTKEATSAIKTLTTVTQKELMVIPNPPRFLREGDEIIFSSKIANLSDKKLNGFAQLILTDAISGKEINHLIENSSTTQNFTVDEKGNTNLSWKLNIPNGIQAIQYKIVAKAGDFSDGEQNALPVLSNRILVTETLPMWVRSNQTKTFSLNKLKNNTSTTLRNHKLTLEITSNPAWYAVQSLPYLMEYPYECAEQTFSRYYSNTLASHILKSNPRIQEVFNQWQTSDALVSNLEKNEELKSIIIQETPWLRDAQSETEQKKRIALLFDLNKLNNEKETAIKKLEEMQFGNGGFPWFKGSNYPNRYITQHIATGFGHLQQLQVDLNSDSDKIQKIIKKAVQFLDDDIEDDYNKLLIEAKKIREKAKTKQQGVKDEATYLAKNHLGHIQLQYLYMRSFYTTIKIDKNLQTAIDYYTNQSATFWKDFNLYSKGLITLIQHRNGNKVLTAAILKSLKENSIISEELGMYWKENTASWYWYQAPIETQALLIEVFSEIENDTATVDELKIWLLKNKQTNSWKTTKQTTEAVYALLLQGSDWLAVNETVDVTIGNKKIEPSKLENVKIEAGTGYYKTSWNANEIKPEMGTVTIAKKDKGIAWGSLYWQYFEDLDKITSAETPLKLSKKLFLKTNSDTGKKLTEIKETSVLKVGDLITVRIELKVDRPMEFVHMKDMRASGLEPINVLSSYKYQDNLGYYESTKDAATNFFFDYLPKGVYVFEYDLRVNNAGNFSNGITTIQSMYAPEFSSHSEGVRIKIANLIY
ncbi:MG2 domain-containing protein [Lutibacter sp.]|uniref:alpha-2-macroglobulin family protein n=1 Tax=Lutibacter sp. TaxID=1925666 RepID=UPI001A33F966|nr:MG2 domain-containing protein [Lutibacter sp.]MBI9040591.1 carboxypeptidase-like regulatory domain-containing protein [Lutibacter sp.]